jgi:hypothetical protein
MVGKPIGERAMTSAERQRRFRARARTRITRAKPGKNSRRGSVGGIMFRGLVETRQRFVDIRQPPRREQEWALRLLGSVMRCSINSGHGCAARADNQTPPRRPLSTFTGFDLDKLLGNRKGLAIGKALNGGPLGVETGARLALLLGRNAIVSYYIDGIVGHLSALLHTYGRIYVAKRSKMQG